MAPKYIAFFVFIFVVGTILGLVIEEGVVGATEQSTLNNLMVFQKLQTEEAWGFMEVVGFVPDFFSALFRASIWDFSFITGGWIYIKWIIWAPLMAMFVWGLVITFVSIFQKVLS